MDQNHHHHHRNNNNNNNNNSTSRNNHNNHIHSNNNIINNSHNHYVAAATCTRTVGFACCKIVCFIIVLPFLVTYIHLKQQLQYRSIDWVVNNRNKHNYNHDESTTTASNHYYYYVVIQASLFNPDEKNNDHVVVQPDSGTTTTTMNHRIVGIYQRKQITLNNKTNDTMIIGNDPLRKEMKTTSTQIIYQRMKWKQDTKSAFFWTSRYENVLDIAYLIASMIQQQQYTSMGYSNSIPDTNWQRSDSYIMSSSSSEALSDTNCIYNVPTNKAFSRKMETISHSTTTAATALTKTRSTNDRDVVIFCTRPKPKSNTITGIYYYYDNDHQHQQSQNPYRSISSSRITGTPIMKVIPLYDYYHHYKARNTELDQDVHQFLQDHDNNIYKQEEILHPLNTTTAFSHSSYDVIMNNNQYLQDSTESKNLLYCSFLLIPAGTLLLVFQVLLAICYYHYHITPQSVALSYPLMVQYPYEIWRCFTGTVAHFDLWHLGFNMMSLHTLSKQLEEEQIDSYPSIVFFLYNISFIPIVSSVWLLLQFLGNHYFSTTTPTATNTNINQQQARTIGAGNNNRWRKLWKQSTVVGYSGVLFTWMVIVSLQRTSTCPIFFLPNVCFRTHTLLGFPNLQFSWSPIIQLFLIQIILPRVSFTGHLAGLIVGYLVHWGWFPIQYIQPSIIIPLLYLLYLRYVQKITFHVTTMQPLYQKPQQQSLSAPTASFMESNIANYQTIFTVVNQFQLLLRIHLLLLVLSLNEFGVTSNFTIPYLLSICYWWLSGYDERKSHGSLPDEESNELGTIELPPNPGSHHVNNTVTSQSTSVLFARGYIISAVLLCVTDSMTMGSWLVLPTTWSTYFALVLSFRQLMMLVSILFLVTNNMVGTTAPEEDEGIFGLLFGYTLLQPMRVVRDYMLGNVQQHSHQNRNTTTSVVGRIDDHSSSFVPFQGTGRVLGSSNPITTVGRNGRENNNRTIIPLTRFNQ